MLDRAIPPQAKRSVLEEAEWEDDIPDNAPSEQGALQREVMRQCEFACGLRCAGELG